MPLVGFAVRFGSGTGETFPKADRVMAAQCPTEIGICSRSADRGGRVAPPAADPSQATGRVKRHDNQLHRARVLEVRIQSPPAERVCEPSVPQRHGSHPEAPLPANRPNDGPTGALLHLKRVPGRRLSVKVSSCPRKSTGIMRIGNLVSPSSSLRSSLLANEIGELFACHFSGHKQKHRRY